ncbi:MAG: DUF4440 domain-containing protein [Rhodospirillaceae bacterium]|nr:DUF4440 domain-containing protein [Rhodospirillaceae bacterium]
MSRMKNFVVLHKREKMFLGKREMRELQAILFANDTFYSAFTGRDMMEMMNVWAERMEVCVVHPGWEPIYGREAVLESWRRILKAPESPEIRGQSPQVLVNDPVGTVVCFEEIKGNFLIATNLFVKQSGRWRMFHHHAAPTDARPSEGSAPPASIN